jgi:hypothetical protein
MMMKSLLIITWLSLAAPVVPITPPVQGGGSSAEIVIGELTSTQKLIANAGTPKLRYLFSIRSTANASVTFSPTRLVGPNGADFPLQLKIDGKAYGGEPINFSQSIAVEGELSGTLPLTGGYEGYLAVSYDGKKQLRKIEVTRIAGEALATIGGLETVEYTWPWCGPNFRFLIKENPGRQGGQFIPSIVSIVRNAPGNHKVQAHYESAKIMPAPDDARFFEGAIVGLRKAGEYTGTLRIAASDSQAFEQPFAILVKHSWWLAGVTIICGVVLSLVLRTYTTEERPRLLFKRRAFELLANIDDISSETGDRTPVEDQVLRTLKTRLETLLQQLASTTDVNTETVLKDIEDKLSLVPQWISARRTVESIEPPTLRDGPRATIDLVRETLQHDAATPQEITTARAALNNLPPQITTLIKADLLPRLDAFSVQIQSQELEHEADGAFLDRMREKVTSQVDAARTAIGGDQLDAARTAFETARAAFVRLLADYLAGEIATTPTPTGFDDASWLALKNDVSEQLIAAQTNTVADEAIAAYEIAYGRYLRALALGLKNKSQSWQAALQPTEKTQKQVGIDQLSSTIDSVLSKIVVRDLSGAATDYRKARSDFQTLTTPLPGRVGVAAAQQMILAPVPMWGAIPEMAARAQSTPNRGPLNLAAEEINSQIKNFDRVVTVVVVVTSVLMGIKVLWIDEPTWGSFKDYATALLWGLGLHQVTFQGIAGLKEKLTK